jgi:hypothetical protein
LRVILSDVRKPRERLMFELAMLAIGAAFFAAAAFYVAACDRL